MVPKSFDPQSVLPARFKRYADCAYYLVHCVVAGTLRRRADRCGYVPLKVAYLREVIPDRVERDLRLAVIEAGVLECDGRYVKGEKSMGYRLTGGYYGPRRQVKVVGPVAERILDAGEERFEADVTLPVHRHLRKWLGELRVDRDQALDACSRLPNGPDFVTMIDMMEAGHVEFSYCRQGRVHSVVTRLPRTLRKSLRLNGEPLVNVDVRNSQPLVLALLTMEYRKNGNRFFGFPPLSKEVKKPENPYLNLGPSQPLHSLSSCLTSSTNPSSSHPSSSLPPPALVTMSIPAPCDAEGGEKRPLTSISDTLKPDEKKYLLLCEDGTFYEYLQQKVGLSIKRSKFKTRFFSKVFFGRIKDNKMTRAFREEFPNVWEVIREAKRSDHRDLARMMQLMESSLVIDGVCGRLMRDHPEAPVVTVHDSIMTTPENVPLVSRLIEEEFLRVGLRPKVSHEA